MFGRVYSDTVEDLPAIAPARPRWRLRPWVGAAPTGPWPPLIGRLLAVRGLAAPAEAQTFLDGARPLPDARALPGFEAAADRLRLAVRQGERIGLFGDFDVDGVTAVAILADAIRGLGSDVVTYLPDRFREGYGLNVGAVDALARLGVTLLVALDCGTSAPREIQHARSLGMDVLVLDHHSAPPDLPDAVVVNPRLPSYENGPLADLASAGLAFLLARALHDRLGGPFEADRYLELVALGTICDVAPLSGPNRTLVQQGLAALRKTERPGLRALVECSRLDPARIDADALGYVLGPRLNAAGRIKHAGAALELLLTHDPARAARLATQLGELNSERQRRTAEAVELAGSLLAQTDAPLLMVGHESFSSGIVGLVAARLTEAAYRPAIVYERGEEESRASCRSIPEFDITAALRTCQDLLVRFGGHRQAAGFTVKNRNLEPLRRRLVAEAARRLDGLDLRPPIDIDLEIPLRAIRGEEIRWLERLAPHGNGNPLPTFLSRGVLVADSRAIGNGEEHLLLKLRDGALVWPAVAFRRALSAEVAPGSRIDVVFSIGADRFVQDGLRLTVHDLRPAPSSPSSHRPRAPHHNL